MKPKKASNKIISVLLALIMLIGMLPLSIIPTQASSYAAWRSRLICANSRLSTARTH